MTSVSINGFSRNSLTMPKRLGYQKHHLIPVQLLKKQTFIKLFEIAQQAGFDPRDFRSNGIYLPAKEKLAVVSGRPLHRGPHPKYNALVEDRLGMIEASIQNKQTALDAEGIAFRLRYLQRGLRRTLLKRPRAITLNKRDPMSRNIDFRSLDNDVDNIWSILVRYEKQDFIN